MNTIHLRNYCRPGLLMLICLACIYKSISQTTLTASQWQSDLTWLQKKIHSDYPNLFYNVTAKQFDSAVAGIQKKIPQRSDMEIKVELIRLVAMFKIGHTGVRFRSGQHDQAGNFMFHFYPYSLYPFSDGIFIKSIDSKYKEAMGGKITKIGKDPVDVALKKIHDVIPCENEQHFKTNIQHYFRLPELLHVLKISESPEEIVLTYRKNGEENKITVKAEDSPANPWPSELELPTEWADIYDGYNTDQAVLWLKKPEKLRYFEYLKDSKTVYVRHSAVVDEKTETIADYFKKVFAFIDSNEVEKLVLDIRLNGGGNNYLNKSVITGIIQSRKINRPGHFFVITGPATFSAAQNLTNELEKYTEAIFVGEPTGENVNFWGDVKTETLPNSKINVVLSWLWWQNLDPRDKRPWTAPTLAVGMSSEDYKKGYDSAMQVILNYNSEKNIETRIADLITAGKPDSALAITQEYLRNPLYRYSNQQLEDKINNLGYSFLSRDRLNEANQFFYINVQSFPQSANVYDSYAESFWKMGKIDEAIKYYQMAIAKDPNGPTGDNSRKMLAMIQKK